MSQATLFDSVSPSHPDTAHAAARTTPIRQTLRTQVHALLVAHPDGLTDFELCERLGLSLADKPSVGKRREECGAVDSLRRRPSPKGNPAAVWVLS